MGVDQKDLALCSAATLHRELSGFRVTASRFFPGFSLERVLAEVTHCQVVKDKAVRQVFYLQAPCGEFFLKRSPLVRTKDRLRHLFLPRRRWAEWRNLHRLRAARIAAPDPVLKGEKGGVRPEGFFLLTRKVDGTPLSYDSLTGAKKLGQYIAFLHARGVYHADLHPENIIIKNNGQPSLLDVQQVFFLPWLPRWLRLYNLGKLYFHLRSKPHPEGWVAALLGGYNEAGERPLTISELVRAAGRYQQRHYRSRAKRCCKNSTEFVVVKGNDFQGYKRRDFRWGPQELHQALEKGETIKEGRVIAFQGVCIKTHHKQFFHQDRCLASWKMSRALEVRDISVPRSLGYFIMDGDSFFLSEFLVDSMLLNDYLSSLTDEREKRRALKKLAVWFKKIHDHDIWQRDFKSSNILCQDGDYLMVDLDGVKVCRQLPDEKKILNLAQLNASLSNAITIKDRLRFYYYYMAGERPSRQQRRAIYRKVWAITTTKNTSSFGLDIAKLKL
jgi:tRNA A-37 threonylcarbamoyl transferase component Bud32